MKRSTMIVLSVLLAAASMCSQQPAVTSPAPVVGPDDSLSITVLGADDLSKTWRVGADGYLTLPLVGRIAAAGRTTDELQKELAAKLKRYYVDPEVSVYIAELRSQPVTVTGAVNKPGVYQLGEMRGLAQVLLLAEGPKVDAGETVTVTRPLANGKIDAKGVQIQGTNQVITFALLDIIKGYTEAADFQVLPGDVIAVSTINDPKLVQVAGDVNKPGSIELLHHDSISLIRAIGMAGGIGKTASAGKTTILHTSDTRAEMARVEHVNLKKIMRGEAPDVMLRAGDVVVVPTSGKAYLSSLVQQASISATSTGILLLAAY